MRKIKISLLTCTFTSYSVAELGFVGTEAYTVWSLLFKKIITKFWTNVILSMRKEITPKHKRFYIDTQATTN